MKNILIWIAIFAVIASSVACGGTPSSATLAGSPMPKVVATPTETYSHICLVAENVNLRAEPTTSSAVVDVLSGGTDVQVFSGFTLSADGGVWRKVSVGELVGWVNARYICK